MTPDDIVVPGPRFNFAQHLLDANAGRGAKAAFVDDAGVLSYAELDERVRRAAAALRALGLKREERVMLLMHDGNDWPVSFLGAMYAGLVPVAVNTLLTADDYAYMLEHSRAQAVLVGGALLPPLSAAMTRADHEVQQVIVSRPLAPLRAAPGPDAAPYPAELEFEAFLAAAEPAAAPGQDRPRRSRLLALFVRLHRPPERHGALARQPVLDGRAVRQGRAGAARGRRLLLRRQALLRLWPGQCPDLPDERGRDDAADGRAADAGGGVQALARPGRTTRGRRSSSARRPATPACWRTRSCRPGKPSRCAWRLRPARPCRPTSASVSRRISVSTSSTASVRPRCCTSSCPTSRSECATAPPAGRCRATRSNCAARTAARCPTASPATSTSRGRRPR